VNENIDIHFFSEKETYYRRHKNSDNKFDTGIKITAFIVVREYNKLDSENQSRVQISTDSGDETLLNVEKGDLVILKSRQLFLEFKEHYEKAFYLTTNISGPLKPHEK